MVRPLNGKQRSGRSPAARGAEASVRWSWTSRRRNWSSARSTACSTCSPAARRRASRGRHFPLHEEIEKRWGCARGIRDAANGHRCRQTVDPRETSIRQDQFHDDRSAMSARFSQAARSRLAPGAGVPKSAARRVAFANLVCQRACRRDRLLTGLLGSGPRNLQCLVASNRRGCGSSRSRAESCPLSTVGQPC